MIHRSKSLRFANRRSPFVHRNLVGGLLGPPRSAHNDPARIYFDESWSCWITQITAAPTRPVRRCGSRRPVRVLQPWREMGGCRWRLGYSFTSLEDAVPARVQPQHGWSPESLCRRRSPVADRAIPAEAAAYANPDESLPGRSGQRDDLS
jgi:hypothetical protein